MRILSVSFASEHDSSAALVVDGQLVAAAEEERFSRRKHDDSAPLNAATYCLEQAGLGIDDIDVLAVPDKPYRVGADSYQTELDLQTSVRMYRRGGMGLAGFAAAIACATQRRLGLDRFNVWMSSRSSRGLGLLRRHFGRLPRMVFLDHHLCHAAASFLTSGYERAAVLTVDGGGGPYATVLWEANGTSFRRLHSEFLPNALGQFYEDCTNYVGLGPFGEGKMMGLASYGQGANYSDVMSQLLDTRGAALYERRKRPSVATTGFPPRIDSSVLDPPFPDFAAAAQSTLQEAIQRAARSVIAKSGSSLLCLGGGVMLNCSSNGALMNSGIASKLWVFPASGDAGLSVGAALLCAAQNREPRMERLSSAYLGPGFSPSDCEASLRESEGISFRAVENLPAECARMLAGGAVLGWFQGRMEIGPRALGGRSILADVRSVEMRDRVNRIKRREQWRPLAPVVLADRAAEFFVLADESPFMLFAASVRPEQRSRVPAIVHVDGTARPQTVRADQHEVLYQTIAAYAQLTGIPMLLNTSFNGAGEPIVCTPKDAISAFLNMGLDALVISNFIVTRTAR
jgi:carbamoyltransferase